MNLIKSIVAVALMVSISASAFASLTKPENGKEYQVLSQPQPTDTKDKIEVTEFFFYTCPHCNVLDPYITEWVKKQGNAISFKRVPVDFGQVQLPLRRMYYTLEAMGKLDQLHAEIFKAIHKDHKILRTDKDVLDFVTNNGIDKQKYIDVSDSFTVQTKMRRAQKMQEDYGIDSVPVLFVDGRYKTSPGQVMEATPGTSEVAGVKGVLEVLSALVTKAKKDHEEVVKKEAVTKEAATKEKKDIKAKK